MQDTRSRGVLPRLTRRRSVIMLIIVTMISLIALEVNSTSSVLLYERRPCPDPRYSVLAKRWEWVPDHELKVYPDSCPSCLANEHGKCEHELPFQLPDHLWIGCRCLCWKADGFREK